MSVLYRVVLLLLGCTCIGGLQAQQCTGNLGENIFEDGDFGSGASNVLLTDPGIAPGYTYTTGLPDDGKYSIVSTTEGWGQLYPTWIRATDNSDDPEGYMMVVNASFSPGIFYEQTIDGLCENTTYEFGADILNVVRNGTQGHILPNVAFLLNDVLLFSTGEVPQTEQWITYGSTFTTAVSQTTIKLTLRNDAPGGFGNDLALDNISFRPCGPAAFVDIDADETIFLCIDDDPITVIANVEDGTGTDYAVQWQSSTDGIAWADIQGQMADSIKHTDFSPGDYYYRYLSSASEANLLNSKCRIISDAVQITVLPLMFTVLDTICEGNSYPFDGIDLQAAGSYTATDLSSRGCDSITNLELTVLPYEEVQYTVDTQDPSCPGSRDGAIKVSAVTSPYTPVRQELNGSPVFDELSAGSYDLVLVDTYGCVTEETLTLTDPPPLMVDIGPDTLLRFGDVLDLTAVTGQDVTNIQWQGQNIADCDNCQSITVIASTDESIIATVSGGSGCSASDTVQIRVSEAEFVWWPNVFSPNGDAVNDVWELTFYGQSVSAIEEFGIYDRWGGLVQSLQNQTAVSGMVLWDGRRQGRELSAGVYVYTIRLLLADGRTLQHTGSITLMK